jgi:TRAP-type C4-dicarboxylate transport system permease small subunit
VVAATATTVHLTVTGLGSGAGSGPADLILGESINAGWTATVVGGGRLGPPVLIDGFANGWRMDPSDLGSAVHGGTVSVVLQWQPQKQVNIALIISAVAIIGCLVLAILPVRRRSRRRKRQHSRTTEPLDGEVGGTALGGAGLASRGAASDEPASPSYPVVTDAPSLAPPFRPEGPRAPVWVALLAGVLTGAVAGAIAAPMAGAAVGLATGVVLLVPRLRVVLGLVAVACVVAAGGYTVLHQSYHHIPPDGAWPLSFGKASEWAWGAVVFLGADGVVDVILRRRPRRGRTGRVTTEAG